MFLKFSLRYWHFRMITTLLCSLSPILSSIAHYHKTFLVSTFSAVERNLCGVPERTRTSDHWIKSLVLYQLSYRDMVAALDLSGAVPITTLRRLRLDSLSLIYKLAIL